MSGLNRALNADAIAYKREAGIPQNLARRADAILYVEDFADNVNPGVTDMSAAFNAAISKLPDAGGKIRTRSKQLRLSSPALIKPRTQVELDGAIIIPDAGVDAFRMAGQPSPWGRTIITGGKIAALAASIGYGVKVDGNYPYITVEEMDFENLLSATYLKDAYCSHVINARAMACGIGFQFLGSSHASFATNLLSDYCSTAGIALNYGNQNAEQTHGLNIIGGAYQNSTHGIWLERCYETTMSGAIYCEGNKSTDITIGVSDNGAYTRAAYNTVLKGTLNTASNVSFANIRMEHAVGVEIDGAAFQSSVNSAHWSVDGYSDKVHVKVLRKNIANPGVYYGQSQSRTKVSEPGKSFYPFNMDAPIAFGDINNIFAKIRAGYAVSGRETLFIETLFKDINISAAELLRMSAGGADYMLIDAINQRAEAVKKLRLSAGLDIAGGDVNAYGLPTSATAGSFKLYVDANGFVKRA